MIPDQRPDPNFTVGMICEVTRPKKGVTAFSPYLDLILEAENGFKFYFQVSGRLLMSNFSTVTHLLLLTPSLLTEKFGLGSFIRVL